MAVKKVSLIALFIALSAIGASVKIPAFIGSVALDAFPALLAAVFVGKSAGAGVAALGHIVSAMLGGMPLGPLHMVIAVEMAVIIWLFAVLYRSGKRWFAACIFIISNGLLAPLPMLLLFGTAFYIALLPPLLAGASVNMLVAILLIPRLEGVFGRMLHTSI